MEAYYYAHLSKAHQEAYHAMLTGLRAVAPAFPVPRLEGQELAEILLQLRLDHPEIFYVTNYSYRFYRDASHVELVPEYLFEKKKILAHREALTARIEKLCRPVREKSEWDKLLFVHDFICQNVRYDKLKKAYSHEIIGPLTQGVSVCEGIAKAVKSLCDQLGIWCVIPISGNNPEKGIKYRHTWNIVRLDGKYYHLDATFDNTLTGEGPIRYDYFCLDDRAIFRDHEPVLFSVPPCSDSSRFYYREKKLSFTKEEEVVRRAAQAIRKNRSFLFHWRGSYLTRDVLLCLCEKLEQAAAEKGKHVQISLNWPQAVLQADFSVQAPAQEIVTQQANEGELL
ncbi:MAG: peptidase [Oscillospiraceae bacterium]|nr:peptidase [Oscillospiraceae bacterium]